MLNKNLKFRRNRTAVFFYLHKTDFLKDLLRTKFI